MGTDRIRRGRNPGKIRVLIPLLVAVSLGIGLWMPTVGAAVAPDPRFGVVAAHEAPWAAADLGAGWTTVPFRWDEIQPFGPADWNPPLSEEQLALEIALGRQVVGVLTGIPSWAADPATGLPRGLETAPDNPENLWAVFVGAVARRYVGRIDHWVVWEGPDQAENWPGSAADFAQLLRVTWKAARDGNSRAVIHLGGVTHWPDVLRGDPPFVRRLMDALAADPQARAHGFYFDVLTLGVYDQPESGYDLTLFYRRLLAEYGLQKEIWVETGSPFSEEGGEGLPEEQAAFLVQALTLGIAGGAERAAIYRMVDGAGEAPYGLIDTHGAPRPAFAAYRVAATYLGGFRSARWERRDDVSVVVVDRGPPVTTVAWARTPVTQTLMVPAQTTRALLVNARGEAWIVHPDRGYYLLTLPGCSGDDVCRIGGTPLLLVEENGAGATARPSPTAPGVTPPPPPTATPTPTPTPIPAATFIPTPSPTLTATVSPSPPPTPTPAAMPSATVPEPVSVFLAGVLLGGLGIAGLAAGRKPPRKKKR